jgi:hypothetical protein
MPGVASLAVIDGDQVLGWAVRRPCIEGHKLGLSSRTTLTSPTLSSVRSGRALRDPSISTSQSRMPPAAHWQRATA